MEEEIPTGITSIATKALLEGLVNDVRALRSDVAESTGVAIRIENGQKALATAVTQTQDRIEKIEEDFRTHQNEEKLWQMKQEGEVKQISTQLGLVAPLTAAHETVLQQAKGAVVASKVLYALLGMIGGGGVAYIATLIGHK